MGIKGVHRRILRSLKVRTNQADKLNEVYEAVFPIARGYVSERANEIEWLTRRMEHDRDELHALWQRHNRLLNYLELEELTWPEKTEITPAKTELKKRLSQQDTRSTRKPAKTSKRLLQDHPNKTNDGGRDGGL